MVIVYICITIIKMYLKAHWLFLQTFLHVYMVLWLNQNILTENLSRRYTTIVSQSSTYQSFTASRANDGNLSTTSDSCSHTGLNKTKAWFQVDLGKHYHLSNVKIHYRKDGMYHLTCIDWLFKLNWYSSLICIKVIWYFFSNELV